MQDSFEEDGLELIDYLRVMWRRRKLIVFGTIFFVVFAGLSSLIIPKTYEVTSHIQVGRVWGRLLENPYLTRELIGSEAFYAQIIKKLGLEISPQEMKKDEIVESQVIEEGVGSAKIPLLLFIRVSAEHPQKAVDIAEAIVSLLIKGHLSLFEERLTIYKSYEKELALEVGRINVAINELEHLIKRQQMDPAVNAPSVILLQSQLGQKTVQLLNYKQELKETRIKNRSKIDTNNTVVLSRPIIPEKPVTPRIMLNMFVAGIMGLFILLMLSFFLDYLDHIRKREAWGVNEK